MKIKYIHNLEYSYAEPVQLGEHRLCIKPRSNVFQNTINLSCLLYILVCILYDLADAPATIILEP